MNVICTFVIIIVLTEVCSEAKKNRIRGIKWWSLANTDIYDNYVDPTAPFFIDESFQMLTRKQRRLVTKNPGTMLAVGQGANMAVAECQHQFSNRKWDCPINQSNGGTIFGKITRHGCRETAFVYALTSASVTYAVSRGCSDGSIFSCSCGDRIPSNQILRHNWEWGGCSDNIDFGYRFARDFVDVVERGRDLRYMMNLHNNEAGRKHVITKTQKDCKCHGMSGSCTVKTCWVRLSPFRQVAEVLKDKFDGATKVFQGNKAGSIEMISDLVPVNPNHRTPEVKDLVYYTPSPSFCDNDRTIGHRGTSGRQCNATSIGVDGCDIMCCGRGYRTEIYPVTERCNCNFHWCCEVTCQTCRRTKQRHICL